MIKKIGQYLKQDFSLLDSRINKFILIGFIGLYSVFFISVYTPFNINHWENNYYYRYVLLGTIIVSISQFVLRPIFGLKTFKYYSLILWALFEMFIIATALHILYAIPFDQISDKIYDYLHTIWLVNVVTAVPYALVVIYLSFKEKLSDFKKIERNTFGVDTTKSNKLLTITGENDKVVLAIKYHQLLVVKSVGNYLEFYYLKGENLAKELVRARLKELEEKIVDTNVIKVHRSYMINVRYISSLKKTKKSYELIVQHIPDLVIPVSSGFKSSFEEALEQKVSR